MRTNRSSDVVHQDRRDLRLATLMTRTRGRLLKCQDAGSPGQRYADELPHLDDVGVGDGVHIGRNQERVPRTRAEVGGCDARQGVAELRCPRLPAMKWPPMRGSPASLITWLYELTPSMGVLGVASKRLCTRWGGISRPECGRCVGHSMRGALVMT